MAMMLIAAEAMATSKQERAICIVLQAAEMSARNIAKVWPWWAWTAHLAAGIAIVRIDRTW